MSNSQLVSHIRWSPNNSGTRTHKIDRITPHCVVGQCTIEALGELFSNEWRQASSNYGIGADGRVGLFVDESCRSWCSSSPENDQRAVTIECASDNFPPYAFNAVVYNKLITLCVDICKRNGKKKLLWLGHCNYEPKSDEMLLTVHRWFASTICPGDWLFSRMGDLAEQVTKQLQGAKPTPTPTPTRDYLQKGDSGSAVKKMQKMLIACGYSCGSAGADGQFGDDTLKALKLFQKKYKLATDGLYGPQTQAKLKTVYKKKNKKIYYVQAGAYKVKANADAQAKALKNRGFSAVIKKEAGVYRVQVGAYKEKANAQKTVKALKEAGFDAVIL